MYFCRSLAAQAADAPSPRSKADHGATSKTPFHDRPKLKAQYRGLSTEEMAIAERLEKLKEERKGKEGFIL